jgi:hypothetical protein
MYAKKLWNVDCISWKEFRIKCERFLNALDCSQEEFEEYHVSKVNTYDFMASQEDDELIINMASPKEAEWIENKCNKIYDEVYTEVLEECREEWGWNV